MPLQLAPLLSTLTIQDKELQTRPFPINEPFAWAQREFIAEVERQYNLGLPVRIIVLKARQLGISTATEGILFWWAFLHPGSNGLVVAHESEASTGLFEKTQMYWETWPFKAAYSLKRSTIKRLNWDQTNSKLRVATARNVQSGRSETLHSVHLSEAAFYLDPESLMTGLNQTMPNNHGTIQIIESTANGVGNWFHKKWLAAERGDSEYIPLFFPWWRSPEYYDHNATITKDDYDKEERDLIRIIRKLYNITLSPGHISWRRWAIDNKCDGDVDIFMQEYPSYPEEAFITSGRNIFPPTKVDECYERKRGARGYLDDSSGHIRFVEDRTGPLTIYRKPSERDRRWQRYFVSGDPSRTVDGDPACIQVINRITNEQVAVWHGQIDPIHFAYEMMNLGYYYNSAELCPEVEGGGQGTISVIQDRGYPHVWQHRWADKAPGKVSTSAGWSTNWSRKAWCIGVLKHLVVQGSITVHDYKTYEQLRNYVVRPNGDWGNADPDIHDDAVMSLAIGVTASRTEGPVETDQPNMPFNLDDFNWDEENQPVNEVVQGRNIYPIGSY